MPELLDLEPGGGPRRARRRLGGPARGGGGGAERAEEERVRGHDQQQAAAGRELPAEGAERGLVVANVLEHVEADDRVEASVDLVGARVDLRAPDPEARAGP